MSSYWKGPVFIASKEGALGPVSETFVDEKRETLVFQLGEEGPKALQTLVEAALSKGVGLNYRIEVALGDTTWMQVRVPIRALRWDDRFRRYLLLQDASAILLPREPETVPLNPTVNKDYTAKILGEARDLGIIGDQS